MNWPRNSNEDPRAGSALPTNHQGGEDQAATLAAHNERLSAAENRGHRESRVWLDNQISALRRELSGIITATRQEVDPLRGYVGTLERRIADQTDQMTELRDRIAVLEERLGEMMSVIDLLRAQVLESRKDLTKQDFLVQYKLADRIKALFGERFPELTEARQAYEADAHRKAGTTPPPPLRREAELVREMCAIFAAGGRNLVDDLVDLITAGGQVRLNASRSALVTRVVKEAQILRDAIEQTGHPYLFVFDVPHGTPANSAEHELWAHCHEGQLVDFVVTPAYVVADKRLAMPHVFTIGGGV
ncbi:hypothetical protein [Acrocarpospora catenulata]|uniref:hypothetical protein n=1 Tax=Acrocarpospora catenulata TaxID=2836182 RepID=UPI001BDB4075|nr:hypothetical protein [Acrocarpospora catenulata]